MTVLNQHLLFSMLQVATKNLLAQVPMLNELDSKTGDGDHGSTMLRVCHCIEKSINHEEKLWDKQVDALGWRIMEQDGGSASMLIGNLFLGLSEGLTSEELSPLETALAFKYGVERVVRLSGAHQGDKTMLDALIPVAETMQADAENGATLEELFAHAAIAARLGAESTKAMVPKRGRAKNMGEKAVGFIDPGATSMAILFESFSQTVHQVH
ncbi:dihydroxyacetone kinase subunit L [Vibrio sp. 404]|uniref:Dihydroxyacetone kinase subunit L n=1 Tax=Vibrio marinisediminis TaxID=2758441 RepID=A0A7W2IU65_9VIBR|nr:dihydroxyacetone kinase subunit L [Vibrio marinisediminis]MBA5763044.1 dihydroxyacetone kinase subunit L [Vibrio marinisediminis]